MPTKSLFSKESLFLLFATVLFSYYICPVFKIPQTDRQVFVYGSMTILKGGVPYKDFFDHKPPLIYLILAIGWHFKWWGVWLVGVFAKWGASLYLYNLALFNNVALKFLVPLTFLITILNPFLIGMGSFTREYSSTFLAIVISMMLINPGKRYFLSGFLFGLAFFTQQEEVIFYFPYIIWHLSVKTDNIVQVNLQLFFKRILRMSLGFLAVLLPLLFWLYLKQALNSFWEQAFLFNFTIYQPSNPLSVRLENSLKIFYHSRVIFFVIAFLIVHIFFITQKRNQLRHFLQVICITGVVILKSFISRLGEEHDTQHYFLTFGVLFSISTLLLLMEYNTLLKQYKWKQTFIVLFFLSSYFFWENALTSKFTQKSDRYYKRIQEILPYVQEVKNKDGQLFVFRNTTYIKLYNELNCLSPSKWIFTTTYNSKIKSDEAEKFVPEIIESIENNKTAYIVDLSVEYPLNSLFYRNLWNNYLNSSYSVIKASEGYVLLKRNSLIYNNKQNEK